MNFASTAPAQMSSDDLAIVEALDTIERKRDESARAQVAIADRLASLRAIVRSAADALRRPQAVAADPSAALDRLSWQLHEERVQADADLERLRQRLDALASERASRLSELTPSVEEIVAQLEAAGIRPLVATFRAGRCSECSSEAGTIDGSTLPRCKGCRRFIRGALNS